MSDQVGFSFQADVVNTASMGHVLTGRLLKALSDGGVDTYALWSAVQLGKLIPVQKSLQNTLYAQIASKKTYQSVLSKALSIGWGHSAPVADLARTVAGSNAIILIGALATGCQSFAAAQCLSELMSIHGLEADTLPSVDVLKGLVGYLAPFVQDLGFSKVVQHITNVSERMIRSKGQSCGNTDPRGTEQEVRRMKSLGSPGALARAIKQLILTSKKGQSDYMVLEMRGSWLPAFASLVLGMSVELRLGDQIVWASGGDRGSINFQLDKDAAGLFDHSLSRTGHITLKIEPDEETESSPISVDYLIGEALEAQFLKRPEINASIAKSIKAVIADLSFHLFENTQFTPELEMSNGRGHRLNGHFVGISSLEDTLIIMGIDVRTSVEPAAEPPGLGVRSSHIWNKSSGLIDPKFGEDLASCCHLHCSKPTPDEQTRVGPSQNESCICEFVGQLIHGFTTTALALAFCRFDTNRLRVQEHVLVGDIMTFWTRDLQTYLGELPVFSKDRKLENNVSHVSGHEDLLIHLGELVCADFSFDWLNSADPYANYEERIYSLGVSGKLYTIYYACVMTDECYDDLGRMIVIQSGRASVNGVFRNAIIERALPGIRWGVRTLKQTTRCLDTVALASGTFLAPHCRPPETRISMTVNLNESVIIVRLKLMVDPQKAVTVPFRYCISGFLTDWAVPRCQHPTNRPYELKGDGKFVASGFQVAKTNQQISREILVYALQGRKLEQLMICGLMKEEMARFSGYGGEGSMFWLESIPGVIQLTACLECCFQWGRGIGCVVMGG
ncbi:hypothetical protein CDEST_07198 [Colletotrichum destructivum]|uniref:Uncharacterized protein n=1 Tax=Colletotrichum destructivum TaxID=34406 RepID=A0AAX4IFX6_9PEZI|nr:hypothetical protein CDEST_07198 [Colletotrichum destructivum]